MIASIFIINLLRIKWEGCVLWQNLGSLPGPELPNEALVTLHFKKKRIQGTNSPLSVEKKKKKDFNVSLAHASHCSELASELWEQTIFHFTNEKTEARTSVRALITKQKEILV